MQHISAVLRRACRQRAEALRQEANAMQLAGIERGFDATGSIERRVRLATTLEAAADACRVRPLPRSRLARLWPWTRIRQLEADKALLLERLDTYGIPTEPSEARWPASQYCRPSERP